MHSTTRSIPHFAAYALALVGLVALPPGASDAKKSSNTFYVANNGVDSPSCGAADDPCRSISQAIANAPAGASIEVGPGRYGDLDGDGALDLPGEEAGPIGHPCYCVIRVDKLLRIYSRDGPALTVIHGIGTFEEIGDYVRVVRIEADGVVFGSEVQGGKKARRSNGFTITDGDVGVRVYLANGVTVAGNVAVRNRVGFASATATMGTVFERNVAVANDGSGFSFHSDGGVMRGNVAIGNGTTGLGASGDGVSVLDNVSTGNGNQGLYFTSYDCVSRCLVQGNVFAGNGGIGIFVYSEDGEVEVSRNSVIGNFEDGIRTFNAQGVYRENNVFGNDTSRNCGFTNLTGTTLDAPGHFWGDPAGMGGDPADGACVDPVTTSTVATSEIPVGPATPLSQAKKIKRRRAR